MTPDTVAARFARQVALRPDDEAVVSAAGRWSYGELAADVNRVTRFLVERGVGWEVHVGVLLPRSYELVVSMMAVLAAGGVYVPLNPSLPDARLLDLVDVTRPSVILTADGRTLPDLPPTDVAAVLRDGDPAPVADRHHPDAAAYVIQTSGSTGRPKCVQLEMGSLVNLLDWCAGACGIGPGERVLQVIASSFDASVRSYLTPLVTGATLCLYDDGPFDPVTLTDWLGRERITVFNPSVPSMFYPVVELASADDFRPLESLHTLALGAETPDMSLLRPWLDSPRCRARVQNVYGPTEAADIALYAELDTSPR
ncbi:AMP-binding protein [Micromonospora sp. LOL_025]|uniref:AMP-binding protein n=1 Tax=Micromonospora sp. LOL_025 TaxID=3345413 RepID=UPI003A85E7CD